MSLKSSDIDSVVAAVGEQLDRGHGLPLYRQVADLIGRHVRSGSLKPGVNLPSQKELSASWGISELTIRRAFQMLSEEGLLQSRSRRGTVVGGPRVEGGRLGGSPSALNLAVAFTDLTHGYPFFPPILTGIRNGHRDIAIQLLDLPPQRSDDRSLAVSPLLADVHGLIMMSPVEVQLLAKSQSQRLPTVLLFTDLADGFSHCVIPDYAPGVLEAFDHLVDGGRKRIALVTAEADRFSTGRWMDAYGVARRTHDLPDAPELIVHAGYGEHNGAEATRQLMQLASPPDAILYASDFMARGGLLAAHQAGLSVPDDLAVIGAGPTLDEGGWTVPLTTIDLGLAEMGQMARGLIESSRDGGTTSPVRRSAVSRLALGQTS